MEEIKKSETAETPPEMTVQTPVAPTPVEAKPVAPTPVVVSTETRTQTRPATSGTTVDPKETASPTTTAEENRRTQGQRAVNLIWESTQAIIAVLVTLAMVSLAWTGKTSELLASAFGMIVGMYFQRTNHTKVGGVGGTEDGR